MTLNHEAPVNRQASTGFHRVHAPGCCSAWFGKCGQKQSLDAVLGGDYGVVSMFPFLMLYALPTILIFTGLIAVYKSTGLLVVDHARNFLLYRKHRCLYE